MTTAARDIERALRREVDFYQSVGASVTFDRTARHNAAIISFRGESRRIIFPASPGDHRAIKNTVADARRKMRELGVFEAPQPAPEIDHSRQAELVREARRQHFRQRYQSRVGSFGAALIDAASAAGDPRTLCPDEIAERPTLADTIREAIPPPPPVFERPRRVDPQPEMEQPIIDITPTVVAVRVVPALPKPEEPPVTVTTPTDVKPNGSGRPPAAVVERAERGRYLMEHHRIAITRLLVLHGDQADKDFRYHEGWDDAKVLAESGAEVPLEKIAEFRRKHFGLLEIEREAKKPKTLEALSALVQKQSEQIQALIDRVKSLEETIAPLRN